MTEDATALDLTARLAELRESSAARTTAERRAAMQALFEELEATVVEDALAVGEYVPDFILRTANDHREVRLAEELSKGPVVLSFYRGQWCPYCNLELQAIQQHLDHIRALGAQVFFIGPETHDNALAMTEKTYATVPLLYDLDGAVMDAFRITFTQPEALRREGAEPWNPNTGWKLPVPATYVIDPIGMVVARFINPDYRYRMDPADIVGVLRELRG